MSRSCSAARLPRPGADRSHASDETWQTEALATAAAAARPAGAVRQSHDPVRRRMDAAPDDAGRQIPADRLPAPAAARPAARSTAGLPTSGGTSRVTPTTARPWPVATAVIRIATFWLGLTAWWLLASGSLPLASPRPRRRLLPECGLCPGRGGSRRTDLAGGVRRSAAPALRAGLRRRHRAGHPARRTRTDRLASLTRGRAEATTRIKRA